MGDDAKEEKRAQGVRKKAVGPYGGGGFNYTICYFAFQPLLTLGPTSSVGGVVFWGDSRRRGCEEEAGLEKVQGDRKEELEQKEK